MQFDLITTITICLIGLTCAVAGVLIGGTPTYKKDKTGKAINYYTAWKKIMFAIQVESGNKYTKEQLAKKAEAILLVDDVIIPNKQ